jgi:hypothetical protein
MKQERRRFQPSLNPCVWFEIIAADYPQRKDKQDGCYFQRSMLYSRSGAVFSDHKSPVLMPRADGSLFAFITNFLEWHLCYSF